MKGDKKEDILTDEYLWTIGNFISSFRINYPREISAFARNRFRQTNSTMMITLMAEVDAKETNSIFSMISLVLFILMISFVCICLGAIIRICIKKRQLEQEMQEQGLAAPGGNGGRRP
jgi:hypothetical protein